MRKSAARGEVPDALGAYAGALETGLVAFIVGGSFVSFQYCEMLWHFFGLSIALERVAVAEAAAIRVRRDEEARAAVEPPSPTADRDQDFAWA